MHCPTMKIAFWGILHEAVTKSVFWWTQSKITNILRNFQKKWLRHIAFCPSLLLKEPERSSVFKKHIKMRIRFSLELEAGGNFFWLWIKNIFQNNKFHSFTRCRRPIFDKWPCYSPIKPSPSYGSGFHHSYDYLAIRKGHNNFIRSHTLCKTINF